jgi:hypothetical protein
MSCNNSNFAETPLRWIRRWSRIRLNPDKGENRLRTADVHGRVMCYNEQQMFEIGIGEVPEGDRKTPRVQSPVETLRRGDGKINSN